jgi:hypothetical protein
LANFDVTSFACYLGPPSTAAGQLEKAIKLPSARFITEGFFLGYVKRMRERPTRRQAIISE